jgi:hypothetical protein
MRFMWSRCYIVPRENQNKNRTCKFRCINPSTKFLLNSFSYFQIKSEDGQPIHGYAFILIQQLRKLTKQTDKDLLISYTKTFEKIYIFSCVLCNQLQFSLLCSQKVNQIQNFTPYFLSSVLIPYCLSICPKVFQIISSSDFSYPFQSQQ